MNNSPVSNINGAPDWACPRCGSRGLVSCETTTSIWYAERPYVIESIPALRCPACDEVLIDGETAAGIKAIARILPEGQAETRKILVPVISYAAAAVLAADRLCDSPEPR